MNPRILLSVAAAGLVLLGCASTTRVQTTGPTLREPLCRQGAAQRTALVLWQPRWRPDQKEPLLREAAAERGIQGFFAESTCFSRADIRRWPVEGPQDDLSDDRVRAQVATVLPAPDRVLLIVVRELGPTLRIGGPTGVAGGTEVVLDLRVLDLASAAPSATLASVQTHWQNGGAWVVKGVQSLDQDMRAALGAALSSLGPARP